MSNTINYEALIQKALRNVVRDILADVAKYGLPGEHHFYITFSTLYAGVQISSRLRERFPETMTIVLQHRYWDMQLFEDSFTVSLSFGGIAEKLVIPFAAMQIFYDPAAAFEVSFDMNSGAVNIGGAENAASAETAGSDAVVSFPQQKTGEKRLQKSDKDTAAAPKNFTAETEAKNSAPTEMEQDTENASPADGAGVPPENYSRIVSLDAFRKK